MPFQTTLTFFNYFNNYNKQTSSSFAKECQFYSSWIEYLYSTDVTIIESKTEIEFFWKIELNRNRFFWLVFFRFWLTAILAKTTHCCEFKAWQLSQGKECWIRWLNYTNRMPQRPRGAVVTAASRCRVLLSLSYVLCGRAAACTWYLHPRVL